MKTIKVKVVRLRAKNQKHQVKQGDVFINDSRNRDLGSLEALVCERVTRDGFAWNGHGIQTDINHLYLISDEEIKKGDWYYNSFNHIISQADKRYGELKNPIPHRKIVATTDKSLLEDFRGYEYGTAREYSAKVCLPQISQSFIKEYVKSGGSIDEVELEIGEYCEKVICKNPDCKTGCKEKQIKLKLDSDNCAIIHTVKDSWSREEVKILINRAVNDFADMITYNVILEDWIKENMK